MEYQRNLFTEYNERTRLEILMCQKLEDVDLKSHLEELTKSDLKGNDFQTYPMKDVEIDLVNDLFYRYL